MFVKAIFFIAATVSACFVGAFNALALTVIGMVAGMPTTAVIAVASSAALTGFGLTVSLFSLAAALFLNQLTARDTNDTADAPDKKNSTSTRMRRRRIR